MIPMVEYALPETDMSARLPADILVIGDNISLPSRHFTLYRAAAGDVGAKINQAMWAAVLIEGGAVTPAIASALRGLAKGTPVIVTVSEADADPVGLLLDQRLTLVAQPASARQLEQALAAVTGADQEPGGMADAGSFAADERIMALQRDAQRMAAAISELAQLRPAEAHRPVTAARIRAHLRARRLRERFFHPELFADPAWDMLLDLGASRLEGRKVSVSSLCIAAAVPTTTALRWVKAMVDRGLFERESDPDDARRAFIHLSAEAAPALDACIDAVLNHPGQ